MKPIVFISYSHSDKKIADKLYKTLCKLNIEVFQDEKIIKLGDQITKKVYDNISACTHLIVIISQGSRISQWVPFEIGLATGFGKNVIQFLTHKDEKPFPYYYDSLYATELNKIEKYFKNYEMSDAAKFINPKPFSINNRSFNDLYLMFGNYTSTIEIDVKYTHEQIIYPEAIEKISALFLSNARKKANELGTQFFNGPNTRLIKFSEEFTRQDKSGHEQKVASLNLGPVSWEDYTILNTFLDYKIDDKLSIRELYANEKTLFRNDRNLQWCKLSNILPVAFIPITKDGFGIIQDRNPHGVSTEGGRFTSGVAENIHRYLDEADSNNLLHRINSIDNPLSINNKGLVDSNYRPIGVPSPILAVQRGLWEEFSEEIGIELPLSSYKFVNIGFEIPKFHPLLIGIIDINLTKNETEIIRKRSPGKDHSENLGVKYVYLDSELPETRSLLNNENTWVPGGLSALITACNYWKYVLSSH